MLAKEKIEKLFQLGINLAEKIKSKVDSLNATDEKQIAFRGAMFFFFCKAYKSYQAVHLLWDRGFSEDASILARTIFELELQARYMREDPKRVRLFLEYDPVLRYRLYLRLKELGINTFVDEMEKRKSELSELKDQYETFNSNYPSGNNWWGGTVRQLADQFNKEVQLYYAGAYLMESNMVHSNVAAVKEYMKNHRSNIEVNCYPLVSNDIIVPSFATVRFLGVLSIVAEALELNLDVEIDYAFREYKKILSEN